MGKAVTVEAIVDTACGWEFDAPLHVVSPFHLYREVGSASSAALLRVLENLLIDLDCGRELAPDRNCWPYAPNYLKRLARNAKRGKARRGILLFRATVTVHRWGALDSEQQGDWDIVGTEN